MAQAIRPGSRQMVRRRCFDFSFVIVGNLYYDESAITVHAA